ncbi:hypothetical protein Tco_0331291 [Tanacetum coccineum]
MTSGRETTPPLGFSAVPTTTTMFAATTPENTPLAYRASTSTNPNPMISPAFMEANYETFKDYDEEREMEPRPKPVRAVTPPLRATSPRVRRRRERVVRFKETQNRGESRVERNNEGGRPSEEASRGNGSQNALLNNIGGNLPPNGHGLPSANSDDKPPIGGSFANLPQGGHIPSTFTNSNISHQNGFTHHGNIPPNSYSFYTQPMYVFPNIPAYANPNPTSLFLNPLGSVTPFVCWIEDYPLPDGLEMPSHIGSYDGKEGLVWGLQVLKQEGSRLGFHLDLGFSSVIMPPRKAPRTRTTLATTTNTTFFTNAELKAMIDQGVTAALAAHDANRSMNGDDNLIRDTGC